MPKRLLQGVVVSDKADKTVVVDARLHDVEPLAYKFMVNFGNDNDLQMEPLDEV